MQGVTDQTPLGKRICEVAEGSGISDFYITPWEPLAYKFNGELVYDQYVYQPEENLPVEPGCADYAFTIGPHRFRVNRMVTRGRYRWVMRLLPFPHPDGGGDRGAEGGDQSVPPSEERALPHLWSDWLW